MQRALGVQRAARAHVADLDGRSGRQQRAHRRAVAKTRRFVVRAAGDGKSARTCEWCVRSSTRACMRETCREMVGMPPSHVLPGRRAAGCAGKWGRQVRGRCTALHCARGRTCVQGRPRAPHHARATRQHLGGLAQPHPCVDQRPNGLGVARDERLAQRRARRRGALHLGAGEPAHSSGERLRHHQETQRPPHDAHEPSQLRARRRHRHRRPATSARGGKRRECKENCFFTLPQ